jgi:Holliday junction resolvase RusA-like endonuclease
MLERIHFTVPLVPPSVNSYVRHVWCGHRVQHYLSKEAVAFKEAVVVCSGGQVLTPSGYCGVHLTIYQKRGQKGDIDNYPKAVLDGLKGQVIGSDAMVKRLVVDLDRDGENPRTEIEVWRLP